MNLVLGGKSRSFPDVMTRAQIILQKTFGMELVELHNVSEIDDPNQKVIEAMNVKKKGRLSFSEFPTQGLTIYERVALPFLPQLHLQEPNPTSSVRLSPQLSSN